MMNEGRASPTLQRGRREARRRSSRATHAAVWAREHPGGVAWVGETGRKWRTQDERPTSVAVQFVVWTARASAQDTGELPAIDGALLDEGGQVVGQRVERTRAEQALRDERQGPPPAAGGGTARRQPSRAILAIANICSANRLPAAQLRGRGENAMTLKRRSGAPAVRTSARTRSAASSAARSPASSRSRPRRWRWRGARAVAARRRGRRHRRASARAACPGRTRQAEATPPASREGRAVAVLEHGLPVPANRPGAEEATALSACGRVWPRRSVQGQLAPMRSACEKHHPAPSRKCASRRVRRSGIGRPCTSRRVSCRGTQRRGSEFAVPCHDDHRTSFMATAARGRDSSRSQLAVAV